ADAGRNGRRHRLREEAVHHDRSWTHPCTPGFSVETPAPATGCLGKPEADIVVPVVRCVIAAVRRAQVSWIVVPGAAADDAAGDRPGRRDGSKTESRKTASRKTASRSRHVSAWPACAIHARICSKALSRSIAPA